MPLQLPVVQTGLEASIQAAMKNAGRNASINLGTSAREIGSLSQPLGRITGQADQFTKSMEAANARVFAFGASVGIINSVTSAFKGLVASTIAVESSLASIYTVLDKTGSSTKEFETGLFEVAKKTGQSFKVAADGALELARQGLSSTEVLKRLNDSLILTRLSGLDSADAVEGLSAAFNSFRSSGITTAEILNKLVAVSQKYAVSEKDLIEGIKRAGSTAQQAGVSFDELAGLITAVQERTARGGAVIGNSFKTIFARLQDRTTLEYLSDLGIGVTDLEGKVLPATRIMEGLAKEFNNFSQIEQSDIAEKLGGIYQLSNLLAAIQDLTSAQSKYAGAVKVSQAASEQAYQKNAVLNQTLESILNRVSVSAEQLGATLGELGVTDNLKSILNFFTGLLDGIQKVLQEDSGIGKFFKGLVAGIGNLISGPGLALFGAIILKLSKDLVQFGFSSLKSFFGIGQAAREIANVEKSVAQALSTNVSLQQRLLAVEGDRAAQLKIISGEIIAQEAMLRKIASTSSAIAPGLYGAGVRSTGQGLRVPKAAEGYMPAVAEEASSVKRGVGGAKPSDKPVVISNFNFGGGKRGTMVANSGEHIVPNFNGSGGSAIFNRDMVRKMGMPSGAQKINSAGGFIPNYASKAQLEPIFQKWKMAGGQTELMNYDSLDRAIQKNRPGAKKTLEAFQESEIYKIESSRTSLQSAAAEKQILKSKELEKAIKTSGAVPRFAMLYPSSEVRPTTTHILKTTGELLKSIPITTEPSDLLFNEVQKGIVQAGLKYAKGIGLSPDIVQEDKFAQGVKDNLNPGAIEAAFGTVFESVFQSAMGVKSSVIGGFDLPSGGSLKTFAGTLKNNHILKEFIDKSLNKELIAGDFKNALNDNNINSMDKKVDTFLNPKKLKTSARGFIPNFADPIKEAVGREMSAGVPASQIYIDQDSSLKNPMNPGGFMVANRRDEPMGGIQGINRARKEGSNPITYGASRGFVPNYANTGSFQTPGNSTSSSSSLTTFNPGAVSTASISQSAVNTAAAAAAASAAVSTAASKAVIINAPKQSLPIPTRPNAAITSTPPEPPKGEVSNEKMLGTIFAVQGALSVLEGVLGETSGGIAQTAKLITSVGSTIATTAFAMQGLSGMGGLIGKVSGALGPFAIAATGLYTAWQEGTKIADQWNGVSSSAAKSLEKVSKAAEGAAVKLSDYGTATQEEIKKNASKLFEKITTYAITTTNTDVTKNQGRAYMAMGGINAFTPANQALNSTVSTASIELEGWTDALKESIVQQITLASAAGIGANKIQELFNGVTVNNKITKDGAEKAASALADIVYSTKKYSSVLDKITLDSPEAQKFLGTPSEYEARKKQVDSFIIDPFNSDRSTLPPYKQGGFPLFKGAFSEEMNLMPGLDDKAKGILLDKKRVELAAEEEAIQKQNNIIFKEKNQALENYIKNLAAENLYQTKITNFARLSANTEINKQKELSALSKDLTVSAEDRSKVESLINLKYEERAALAAKELNTLTSAKSTIEEGLKTTFTANPLTKSIISENLPDVLNKNQDLFLRIASLKDEQDIAKTSLEIAKAFKIEQKEADIIAKGMVLSFIEIGKNIKKSNDEVSISTLKNKELLLIDLERQKTSEKIKQSFEKYSNSLEITLGNESIKNIKAQSAISLSEMRKEAVLANPNTFSGITTQAGKIAKTQEIEKKAFEDRIKLEKEISDRQESIELSRKLSTLDNITALNSNTKKINELIDELKNQIMESENKAEITSLENTLQSNIPSSPENIGDSIAKAVKESGIASTKITPEQSKKFFGKNTLTLDDWENLLTKIAYKESGFDPKQVYTENFKNQKGEFVKSTGLFQVSTESVNAWRAKNNQKSITQSDLLDPQKNAMIAAQMMKQMIESSGGVIAGGSERTGYQGLSKYWSVMRGNRDLETINTQITGAGTNIPSSNNIGINTKPVSEMQANILKYSTELQQLKPDQLTAKLEELNKSLNQSSEQASTFNASIVEIINKRKIETEQTNAQITEFNKKQEYERNREKGTFTAGLSNGLTLLDEKTQEFQNKFGEEIPGLFSSSLAAGIEGALDGTKSIKDSLLDAAMSFTKALSNRAIGNFADIITGGIGGIGSMFGQGNKIPTGASGGAVYGGSGSKDDVPAMLMGGEYIINKKSVNKYGPRFLEAINSGKLDGYAKGGRVKDYFTPGTYGVKQMTTKDDLLGFATQEYTSGSQDKIRSGNGFASIALEPESIRLTNFGRRNSPEAQRAKDVRKQMFGIYIDEMKKAAELKKQEEEEKKARKKAIKNMLIMAAVSVAGSAITSGAMSGFKNAYSTSKLAGGATTQNLGAGFKGAFTGGGVSGLQGNNYGGMFNMFSNRGGVTKASQMAGTPYDFNFIGPIQDSSKVNINPSAQNYVKKRATGGEISETAGIDTIPTMLSGGEFVMNRAAAENIGPGNLQAMNAGASKPMSEEASKELNNKLISKFDELIGTTEKSTGAITINVDGSTGKTSESSNNQNGTSNQQLSRQIKDAVLKVIQEEKRLGGQLRRGM